MQDSQMVSSGETLGPITEQKSLEICGIQWSDGERFTRPFRLPLKGLINTLTQEEANGAVDNQS